MKLRSVITALSLVAAAGLTACGDRPGRDDERLFENPYPDLASVPADKAFSRSVPRQTKQAYADFQAVSDNAAPIVPEFNPLAATPVAPPRAISETRSADEFTQLQLDNATATALLIRQQETDVFFGIEEQMAQDALQRAREAQAQREMEQRREEAIAELQRRQEEQRKALQKRAEFEALMEMEPEVEVVAGPQKQPASLAELFFDTSIGDPVSIVYFNPESDELDARSRDILGPIAEVAKRNNQNLILHGHTNGYRFTRTQAHRDQHLEMSRKRAVAVKNYLVTLGVPADKIRVEWFGDLRPVWAEVNGMTSQGNRRVEIFIEIPQTLLRRGSSLLDR